MIQNVRNFWNEESGQDLVEYVLVVGVVALGAVAGLGGARDAIKGIWTDLATALNGVTIST